MLEGWWSLSEEAEVCAPCQGNSAFSHREACFSHWSFLPTDGSLGVLLTVHIIKALLILSWFALFLALFEVPCKGGNYVNPEPLELSLTIFSFISFNLCINESPRPLKCELFRSLPPYSYPEPHPSCPADWSSLLAGHPSLALIKSSVNVCGINQWLNEWDAPLSGLFSICSLFNFFQLSLRPSPCLATCSSSPFAISNNCLIFQGLHNQASPLLSKSYFQFSVDPCALYSLVMLSC